LHEGSGAPVRNSRRRRLSRLAHGSVVGIHGRWWYSYSAAGGRRVAVARGCPGCHYSLLFDVAYRHPAGPTNSCSNLALGSASHVAAFSPVHLSTCPPSHHVPCSRSRMTSLLTLPSRLSPSLLVRPSVSVSAAPPVDSFTRPNHVSERSAQTPAWDDDDDAASNADTNTPTRQGQYEALSCPCSTSNLQLHPITSPNPPASISIPSTSLSCALVSLYRCPTLPCMSLCAISRALSRFHHVIHPTLTPTSTPPISLTHRSIAKTGACSCSHVSPSLQRRLVRKYSSPSYPPSLLPFASPLCSFVKSPPSPPQPANPVQALRCSST
jgi:hypothetical protein